MSVASAAETRDVERSCSCRDSLGRRAPALGRRPCKVQQITAATSVDRGVTTLYSPGCFVSGAAGVQACGTTQGRPTQRLVSSPCDETKSISLWRLMSLILDSDGAARRPIDAANRCGRVLSAPYPSAPRLPIPQGASNVARRWQAV